MYAPTSDYKDEAIEELYKEVEVTMAKVHKKHLIQGDWNAVMLNENRTSKKEFLIRLQQLHQW